MRKLSYKHSTYMYEGNCAPGIVNAPREMPKETGIEIEQLLKT